MTNWGRIAERQAGDIIVLEVCRPISLTLEDDPGQLVGRIRAAIS